MYGQAVQAGLWREGIGVQQKDLPGRIPGAIDYEQITAHPYIVEGTRNQQASAASFGRGLLSVSNKPSEHNISNMPVVVVTSQPAMAQFSAYSPRLTSHNIPRPSSYGG